MTYNSSAYIPSSRVGYENGCAIIDSGFWHVGHDALLRDNLTDPVTRFNKYSLGGVHGFPTGDPWEPGFDLSQAKVSLTYVKK